MNACLPAALAAALMPFAPPKSEVHKIVRAASTFDAVIESLTEENYLGRVEAVKHDSRSVWLSLRPDASALVQGSPL